MKLYASLIFFALFGYIRSEGYDIVIKPCTKNDKKCLSDGTSHFLERTSAGIPKFDVRPLDPLIITSLDVVVDEATGLVFNFKNLNVTGLKNQKFSDFAMDVEDKSVLLKTKAENLHIVGHVDINLTKHKKKFSGEYSATANALGTTKYNYSFAHIKDQDYFIVGPEKNTCEMIGVPEVSISDDLRRALDNDPDAQSLKANYELNQDDLRRKTVCKIVETAYGTLVHNIRACAKVFPKSYFFSDV